MSTPETKKPESAGLLVDLGPLILFLGAYWFKGIIFATIVFMAATAVALVWSRIKTGKVSPLLFFSGIMVLVFGTATVVFQNKTFIQMKPTAYYLIVSAILFSGFLSGKPTLKAVIGTVYPELNDYGWQILTRNFAWFFIIMAIANELVWRNSSFGFWLGYKLWGAMPATFLFGLANVPMILRHSDQAEEPQPPVT